MVDPGTVLAAARGAVQLHKGVKALQGWLEHRRNRRLEHWWWELCSHPGWNLPPEDVQEQVRAKLEDEADEAAREVIWCAVRDLVNSMSDESLVVIASLAAEQMQGRRAVDPFFRGAVRMLADLSAAEVGQLRELVASVHDMISSLDVETAVRLAFRIEERSLKAFRTLADNANEQVGEAQLAFDATRLLRLLRDNDLATQTMMVYGSAALAEVRVGTIRDLARHVRRESGRRD